MSPSSPAHIVHLSHSCAPCKLLVVNKLPSPKTPPPSSKLRGTAAAPTGGDHARLASQTSLLLRVPPAHLCLAGHQTCLPPARQLLLQIVRDPATPVLLPEQCVLLDLQSEICNTIYKVLTTHLGRELLAFWPQYKILFFCLRQSGSVSVSPGYHVGFTQCKGASLGETMSPK